jgi:hypothetical protein
MLVSYLAKTMETTTPSTIIFITHAARQSNYSHATAPGGLLLLCQAKSFCGWDPEKSLESNTTDQIWGGSGLPPPPWDFRGGIGGEGDILLLIHDTEASKPEDNIGKRSR